MHSLNAFPVPGPASGMSPRLTALVGAIILTAALLPATALPAAAAGGSTVVGLANGHRADANLDPLTLHGVIDQIAVERGRQLASDERLGHDMEHVKRRFSAEGICWTGLGEIVAMNSGGDYAGFAKQWFDSPLHRDIMLGDYTHAGGSRERGNDGRYYAVMIVVKLCDASTSIKPSGGFADLGGSQFGADIRWLVTEGITAGCTADRYCPRSPVTRAQMASFLRRATGIPTSADNAYIDDDTSIHEADINGVAAAGITAGCTEARFCPGSVVTRGQMASFLARALRLPPAPRDWFRDDNGSMHEPAINRLAHAGITGGCSSGRFCPDASVTREQMAGFLRRAFGG